MAGVLRAWRSLGGLLTVCMLSLMVLAPTLDRCICFDTPAGEVELVAFQSPSEVDGVQDKGMRPCVHGHCHQPAAVVPPDVVQAIVPVVRSSRPAIADATLPLSYLQFGLIRPPRA